MDKERLKNSIRDLEKKFGKNIIVPYGKGLKNINIFFKPTNIKKLDIMLQGGLPEKRLIEVFGPESSGKTTLAYYLCSQFPYSAFIDVEGTFDESRASMFNNKNLFIGRPTTGEEAIEITVEMLKANVPFIVIDSVAAMYPGKQIESEIGKDQISPLARLMSQQFLPKVIPFLKKSENSIILCINQLRDNITKFGWGDPEITPGGKALRFAYSVRIEIRRRSWIGSDKEHRYGLFNAYRIVKSKVATPWLFCEFPLLFNYGYCNDKEEVKEILKKIRQQKRKDSNKKKKERNL